MSAMLRSLRIRNLALVEELEWELPAGFTAVTGETGAGKSVILGALKFLLGERADRSVVRTGASAAGIEAVFDATGVSEIDALLEESGMDSCQGGELILKRTIASEGSGKQFINGSPCNLSVLKRLGELLVDLHGPHDHQSLFSRREQTLLLDRFSDALPLREAYLDRRRDVSAIRSEIEELEAAGASTEGIDQLRILVDEITSAELSETEEEALNARHKAASNSQRLIELSGGAVARLEDEERGVDAGLNDTGRLLRDLGRLDERAEPLNDSLEKVRTLIDSLLSDLRDYASGIEIDAAEFRQLEDRMNLIASLRRKYGPTVADVLARRDEAANRIGMLSSMSERMEDAARRLAEATIAWNAAALRLSEKRRSASATLAKTVTAELSDLGFLKADFRISLEALPVPGPDGAELAEFVFSPNPGESIQPLRAIASSGEISRVMLALKSALAAQDKIPLLVFDEIDANVGGEIATRVAGKMSELGRTHQVLCITHLPQVAGAASTQYKVEKSVEAGRTETHLQIVDGEERVEEVARMLGGVNESAKTHARTLIHGGASAKPKTGSRAR